jgi:iron complex transport system substrate-binding protein
VGRRDRGGGLAFFALAVAVCAAVASLAAAHGEPAGVPATPQRIVSMNMCTDELVLRLVPRSRIASVTWLSRDAASSNVAGLAADVPVNHGLAEEIIPLDPDLILAGVYTTRTAVAMLKQTHFPLVEVGIPGSVAEVRTQIRDMAKRLDAVARGEEIVGQMDAALAASAPTVSERRPTALVFNPNGFTAGAGTLVDDIITRAGLDNLAPRLKLGNVNRIPLELLVRSAPEVLIVASSRDGPPSLATELLQHPVLAHLGARTVVTVLPTRLWTCAGPAVVDAIAQLHAVADQVRARTASR